MILLKYDGQHGEKKKKCQNWVNVIVQTEMLAAVNFWSWNVAGCHSS